jgi:thymidine kinase
MPHDEPMPQASGRVEVIAGPMFAGKTEELLRRVRRAAIAGRRVAVFTHALDTRSGGGRIASHAGLDAPSTGAGSLAEIVASVDAGATDMVAIDEAHFFGPELLTAAADLAARDLVVVIAGLDVTFTGEPFEPMPSLMALAERVDKLTAVCTVCGDDAVFHQRITPTERADVHLVTENVGGLETYQARCRRHFSRGERSGSA